MHTIYSGNAEVAHKPIDPRTLTAEAMNDLFVGKVLLVFVRIRKCWNMGNDGSR